MPRSVGLQPGAPPGWILSRVCRSLQLHPWNHLWSPGALLTHTDRLGPSTCVPYVDLQGRCGCVLKGLPTSSNVRVGGVRRDFPLLLRGRAGSPLRVTRAFFLDVLTGNKGAVGVSFMFNGTSFGFVNCHLTSGNEKTAR